MSVVTMRSKLTEADVRAIMRSADAEERAVAAQKVALAVDYADLTDEERATAEYLLKLIAADSAAIVRRALAQTLRSSPKLPHEVARKLAEDIDQIATHVLRHSPVLTDGDLIEILRAAGPAKQVAIAGRATLSKTVTGEIARRGAPDAVRLALANDNAEFDTPSLETVLQRLGDVAPVTEAMARRRALPVGVVEKLVALVSGEVFDHLVNHHELPPQLAIDIASNARERATLDLVEQAGLQRDLLRFAQQLNMHGRLTPSFLMRALCVGHIQFVEHALAELAGITHQKAWLLMHDAGALGLKTLLERAGLPARMAPAFRAALDVFHELQREGVAHDREKMRLRMIERSLTLFTNLPREELDYLLEKLDAAGLSRSVALSR